METTLGPDADSDGAADSTVIVTTSPEDRQFVAWLDEQGRTSTLQVAGLEPLALGYDTRGRVATVTLGVGASARVHTLEYDAPPVATDDGWLDRSINAVIETTSFTSYDGAGRPLTVALPESNTLGLGWDANSNLTTLTPPGRPPHTLSRTPLDLLDVHTAPAVGPPAVTVVDYDYNADRQLELINRPDGKLVDLVYEPTTGRVDRIDVFDGATLVDQLDYAYYQAPSVHAGKLQSLSLAGQNVGYGYQGPLVASETWSGLVAGSVGTQYNADLGVSTQVVAGTPVSYAYDNDALLTSVGALALSRVPPVTVGSSTTNPSRRRNVGDWPHFSAK